MVAQAALVVAWRVVPLPSHQSFGARIGCAFPSRTRLRLAPLKIGSQLFGKPRILPGFRAWFPTFAVVWRVHPHNPG